MSNTCPVNPEVMRRSVAAATSGDASIPSRIVGNAWRRIGVSVRSGLGVDPILVGPLLGEALGEVDDGGLARGIGDVVRTPPRERTGREDRQRSTARGEVPVRRPGDVERPGQVHVDDLGEVGRVGAVDTPDAQQPSRHDDVVEPAQPGRDGLDALGDRGVVADIEAGRPPVDLDAGALTEGLVGDGPADPVRPADDVQPRARERPGRADRVVGRLDRAHLQHPVGEDEVDPGRDLEVHLVAGDREDAGARHVAQDEAAVVGGGEVAGRLGRRVGAAQDVGAEDLRRLAAPVSAAVRDRRRPPRRR